MGGCCCCYRADGEGPHEDEDDLNPFEQHLKDALQPLPPPDPLAYAKMPPHIFIMGPPSVGKTSLFMRWAYPDIDPDDAVGVVSETSTFHCESAMLFDRKCFLWDISGESSVIMPSMELLTTMYVPCLIYVVSMLDIKKDSLSRAYRYIRLCLAKMNNTGFFLLLFNTYDLFADEETPFELTKDGRKVLNLMMRSLEINRFINLYHQRFHYTVCNVKYGWSDPRLHAAGLWMYQQLATG